MAERQFITNEQGERVGVLLDLAVYEQLTRGVGDRELLTALSEPELRALADSRLAPAGQQELDKLLAKQAASELSKNGLARLDTLLDQVDQLNIVKARARYTLQVCQSQAG
jgi:hypothetical protein